MTDEFITKGITNDRYLKATRLVEQFQTEMFQMLENVSKETIAQQPDLFGDDVELNRNKTMNRTEPLGHFRIDSKMARVNSDGENLIYHVCIEWTKPSVHGFETEAEGATCVAFYKLKNLDRAEYERVRQETREQSEWDEIQFDDDVWNADLGIFAIPVRSGPAVKAAFETLQAHFREFGSTFGEEPSG